MGSKNKYKLAYRLIRSAVLLVRADPIEYYMSLCASFNIPEAITIKALDSWSIRK